MSRGRYHASKEPPEGRKKRPCRCGQARKRHATQSGTRRGQSGEEREGSSLSRELVAQGIHQVQAAPGFVWKPVTSKVDSGAINCVVPSSVSAKALVESNASLNGVSYHHTADGTRIPNLGQKTLETVSEDGSTQSNDLNCWHVKTLDFRELANAGNLVVRQKRRFHREP